MLALSHSAGLWIRPFQGFVGIAEMQYIQYVLKRQKVLYKCNYFYYCLRIWNVVTTVNCRKNVLNLKHQCFDFYISKKNTAFQHTSRTGPHTTGFLNCIKHNPLNCILAGLFPPIKCKICIFPILIHFYLMFCLLLYVVFKNISCC